MLASRLAVLALLAPLTGCGGEGKEKAKETVGGSGSGAYEAHELTATIEITTDVYGKEKTETIQLPRADTIQVLTDACIIENSDKTYWVFMVNSADIWIGSTAPPYGGPGTYQAEDAGRFKNLGCTLTVNDDERSGTFLCNCELTGQACDANSISPKTRVLGQFRCSGEFKFVPE